MSNCRALWIARKTSTSPIRREIPLIRKTGCGTEREERQRDRWTDGQKAREGGGRMQGFMKKEDNNLIDVENVETTGELCCYLS